MSRLDLIRYVFVCGGGAHRGSVSGKGGQGGGRGHVLNFVVGSCRLSATHLLSLQADRNA